MRATGTHERAGPGWREHDATTAGLLLLRAATQPPADPTAEVDLRDALVRILLQLPPRQRAVLVLRYWEQLSEAETAAVLGWPEGTVKSGGASCGPDDRVGVTVRPAGC
jgi:RNA polymerase sigma factor (sigma-70 family)